MRILVWATTFGADLLSSTRYLEAQPGVEVKVVLADPDGFRREPIAKLMPVRSELVRRRGHSHVLGVPFFRPDVTVLDNRVPLRATSRAGFVLWHGFGWKGPNDRQEFRVLHRQLARAFGDPLAPNPRFVWQCFGPWDFQHRTQISGFHPSNCRILGAASHDDLRKPFDRGLAAPHYPFDVANGKTVLFAPTWHYGEVFSHWGTDRQLLPELVRHLARRGVNLIMRLHDSFRFDAAYVRFLEGLGREHGNVLLKFKDRNPDNFLDMQVADVLLTNYSSIANLFYATLRPTVHIYPVKDADEAFLWRRQTIAGTVTKEVASARYIWKLPPESHGGLLARSPAGMIAALDRALDEPDCCRATARAFLDEHMLGADGRSCLRIHGALRNLVNEHS